MKRLLVVQMQRELAALKLADISVFAVAMTTRVDERLVLSISTLPQLIGRNYFISPSIANLNGLSLPLATQVSHLRKVFYSGRKNSKTVGRWTHALGEGSGEELSHYQ